MDTGKLRAFSLTTGKRAAAIAMAGAITFSGVAGVGLLAPADSGVSAVESAHAATIPAEGVSGNLYGVDWSLSADGSLVIGNGGEQTFTQGNTGNYSFWPWFDYCGSITSVRVDGTVHATGSLKSMFQSVGKFGGSYTIDLTGLDMTNVTSTASMFSSCGNISTIILPDTDTSNISDMSYMFSGCSKLSSLDLSKWNTSGATDMSGMFASCSEIASLDVSDFDTGNVTSMKSMFNNCSNLTSLNVSSFDTGNVTNMLGLFMNCTRLSGIDISMWNIESVADARYMFRNCAALTSIDLSALDATSLANMGNMFADCTNLASANLGGFITASTTNLESLFQNCSSLTSVNLDGSDTSNVQSMIYMFNRCTSLVELNLTSFDTSSVSNMGYMFGDCSSLETVYVSESWTTQSVTSSAWMFTGDENIVGGEGTVFDSDYTDATYALIDGGASNPGYLTYRAAKQDQPALTVTDGASELESKTVAAGVTSNVTVSGYGELTAQSDNEPVATAQVTGDDSVAIAGVSEGTANVTVERSGNETYRAASKTIPVTVGSSGLVTFTAPVDGTPAGVTYNESSDAPSGIAAATASGSGVVEGTYEQFGTLDSGQTSATTEGEEGVHIAYFTVDGAWTDSGPDPASEADNHDYVAGTFQVTVPKEIVYEGMRVGQVSTSDTYDVWARGAIPSGRTLSVAAAGAQLANASQAAADASQIGAQVSSAKAGAAPYAALTAAGYAMGGYSAPYTADELVGSADGSMNADGGLKGTHVNDTIALSGVALSEGTWTGAVVYTATLANA